MCRVAIISKDFKDYDFLEKLFSELNKSAGGDGLGIGWNNNGIPNLFKGQHSTTQSMAKKICEINSDNGILFHCRKASVGGVNDKNCHPYIYKDTMTIMNGHIDGTPVLKLMMMENLDKYSMDGWSIEKIISTTDSDILSYFIWKRGFEMVSMMDCGTVITMYPDKIKIYVGGVLEAIQIDENWIYASAFSVKMGLAADQWLIFGEGTDLTLYSDDRCIINNGYYIDGVELWKEKQKKKKNKENIEVAQ